MWCVAVVVFGVLVAVPVIVRIGVDIVVYVYVCCPVSVRCSCCVVMFVEHGPALWLFFSFLDSHRGVWSTSASGPNGGPSEHRTLAHWKAENIRPLNESC